MSPPRTNAREPSRKGTKFATNFIFYAGKYQLMLPADLKRIGNSSSFPGLFLAVCKENPKSMKALMRRGEDVCEEGEQESAKTKKERKKEIEARIAVSNRTNKRKAGPSGMDEFEIRAREAKTKKTGPAPSNASPTTTAPLCTANVFDQRLEGLTSQLEANKGGKVSEDDSMDEDDLADEGRVAEVETPKDGNAVEHEQSAAMKETVAEKESLDDQNAIERGKSLENNEEGLEEEEEDNDNDDDDDDEEEEEEYKEGEDKEGSEQDTSVKDEYEPEDDDDVLKYESEPSDEDRQDALVRGEPLRIDLEYCCMTVAPKYTSTRLFEVKAEFEDLLEKCIMNLDPEMVKDALSEYLDNRIRNPTGADVPVASSSSSTEDILGVLQVLGRISQDASIRCAAAQMMLYRSVRRQSSSTQTHLNILRKLAKDKAKDVSEKEMSKIYKSYERDYFAGKRWLGVVSMFGGGGIRDDGDDGDDGDDDNDDSADDGGIVILFIVSDIGPWYIGHKFTMFQRQCLKYIAGRLYGIKNLVSALGPNALEQYCLRGCLDEDTLKRVEDAIIS